MICLPQCFSCAVSVEPNFICSAASTSLTFLGTCVCLGAGHSGVGSGVCVCLIGGMGVKGLCVLQQCKAGRHKFSKEPPVGEMYYSETGSEERRMFHSSSGKCLNTFVPRKLSYKKYDIK